MNLNWKRNFDLEVGILKYLYLLTIYSNQTVGSKESGEVLHVYFSVTSPSSPCKAAHFVSILYSDLPLIISYCPVAVGVTRLSVQFSAFQFSILTVFC